MKSENRAHAVIAVIAIIGLAVPSAFAANGVDTWTGGAGDDNWATSGNWTGVNAPPIAGDTPEFGSPGIGGLALNNNITAATSFAGITFNAGAPSFTLDGNSITTTAAIADFSTNAETIDLPIILSGTHSLNATNGGFMAIAGVISGSSDGITKIGGGTVSLDGPAVNTYTGATAVNAGTLQENFANIGATANLISSSSALAFGGGALQIIANSSSASSQTFASTTLNAGASAISAAPSSGGPNPALALGAFTIAAGGVVVINGPAYSSAPTTTSGEAGSAGNASTTGLQPATAPITTTSGTANEVFQSTTSGNADYYCYGTVGLYDFAAVSGSSPFTITGYSQISASTSGLGTGNDGSYYLDTSGFDVNNTVAQTHFEDIAASFSPSANTTSLGGYRYNANAAITTTLSGVQSVGAILVTPNVGANNDTIAEGSSGVLEPGWRSTSNSGGLAIYQNNVAGFLVLSVVLSDGKTAGGSWMQSGAGTVVYAATNTFTGSIYLNSGVSEIKADSGLGASSTGATIKINGGTILGDATFTLDNSGSNKRGITLGNNGGSLATVTGTTMTVDGAVSGTTLTVGIPASSANGNVDALVLGTGSGTANTSVLANGTVALTGTNTWTGGTILDSGTLSIAASSLGTGGLSFNGGALQWAPGANNDISSQAVTFNSNATLDVNGNNVILANSIGNNSPGALTVESSSAGGVLNLKGANTWTGGTIVSSGTLNALNTSGSATGTNTVTVQSGAGLGGSGFISGNIIWQSGAVAALAIGSQLTVGTVTLNNNTVTVNVPGSIPLQPGTYTLMNYTAAGSTGTFNATPAYTGAGVAPGMSSVITTSNGVVTLTVTAIAGIARTWVGDGILNAWDYTTTNWLNGGVLSVYSDGNLVTFDDSGSDTPAIDLTSTLKPASVWVNAGQNYTFAGAGQIAGSTALVKTNSGTLTLLTANTYSGPTTIGQGTLQLGNGTTSGSVGTNIIQDNGLLILDLPGNNTFANTVTGTGNLTADGTGTLTLTASNSYTGGTLINSGSTLQLATGGWFGSGAITDDGILTFNSSGNLTVNNAISGIGSLTLAGNGTVALTAADNYDGGTTINNGALLVNNTSGSGTGSGSVTMSSGGHLGGSGTIAGAVVINSGGTFSPGNPVGTLTIENNFTVNNGAVLNYTLGTTSDLAVVTGNLALNGTLNITNGAGFTTTTYTLFTYGGTLTLGNLTLNLPANTTATLLTNTPGQINLAVQTLQTGIPAFPGALGFGRFAFGARIGGSVYHITNTNDSGAGSFRDAVSQPNRFIVFDVGGTITLQSAVPCSGDLYIAGQTAPGGIAIIGHEVSFSVLTNDIVRFLRIRPGSIAATTEDAINMGDATNMIFDHDSLEFAPYNNIDATGNYTGGNQITMQNCILADPISQQFNAHTEALNNTFSWFYNIFASAHDRNPLAKINNVFINNVIYNFEAGYTTANTSGHFSHDIINNYFITGPATTSPGDDFFQFDSNQSVYAAGNLLDSSANGTLGGSSTAPSGDIVLTSPWSSITTSTPTFSTAEAYHYDVSMAGAFPVDQVDQLVFNDVTSLGTSGMGGGLWTSQTQTGLGNDGYGVITPGVAPVNSSGDGIPDYYKEAIGLNPSVANSLTPGTGGYTKLENYLNWLALPHAVTTTNSPIYVDLSQYARGFTNWSPNYVISNPSNGTVTVSGGYIVNFTPDIGFIGLGSFQFVVTANDGSAMTNTISICVTPYNAVTATANPIFTSISNSANNVAFTGAGGIPNANFILFSSTNLTAPLANWIPLTTNTFDSSGNFNFTAPAPANASQTFYILEMP